MRVRSFAIVFLSLFAIEAQARPPEILVVIDKQTVLTLDSKLKTVAIGAPEIANARSLGANEVQIIGVKDGETSLFIWMEDGRRLIYLVKVRAHDPKEIVRDLNSRLGAIAGIAVRIISDRVYVEGMTTTQEDFERVRIVLKDFPEVRNVTMAPHDTIRRLPQSGSDTALPKAAPSPAPTAPTKMP